VLIPKTERKRWAWPTDLNPSSPFLAIWSVDVNLGSIVVILLLAFLAPASGARQGMYRSEGIAVARQLHADG
jgi:hypothetical protein